MDSTLSLSTCIIDDEVGMRNNLKHHLNSLDLPVRLVGEAGNVEEGIILLKAQKPDLVFLDVEMPDGKGFDILKRLPELQSNIIFVTAHNRYAVEAFRFSALDYLLKPIDADELKLAVGKAVQALEKESYQLKINTFLNNMEDASSKHKKIVLKNSDSIFAIDISEIIRLEASNNYTTFFVENQTPIIISKTLKEYEDLLANHRFYRIHQSHLINLDYFVRYDKKEGGMVVMKDKTSLPLSTRRKDMLFEYLANNKL